MAKNKQEEDLFDFGFTVVSEDELDASQHALVQIETNEKLQKALDNLYNSILPLLDNLAKNPEKDYIHWPNRISKIADFKTRISDIYNTTKA